jgi:signal peptidase I
VEAFERNARQEGAYGGYINEHLMAEGRQMRVPVDSYVALGDNSANSADSRYWGFVPDRSVIGKALFIYYPFTQRWGVSE